MEAIRPVIEEEMGPVTNLSQGTSVFPPHTQKDSLGQRH